MKILIFSGTHPRHLFIHRAVVDSGADFMAIVMQREELLPKPPGGIPYRDQENFVRHFQDRYNVEQAFYGHTRPSELFGNRAIYVSPDQLNSPETAKAVQDFAPDMVFIFGTNIIKNPVIDVLPELKINLHLGLSPWYKGGATLFWPFYFLKPQFAGSTFHQIVPAADAGDILHQSVPVLEKGDGIHDVGAKTVCQARTDLVRILSNLAENVPFKLERQRTTGRVWIGSDFLPAHLRVIYDLYDNKMVDEYLSGNLGSELPKLIRSWQ